MAVLTGLTIRRDFHGGNALTKAINENALFMCLDLKMYVFSRPCRPSVITVASRNREFLQDWMRIGKMISKIN